MELISVLGIAASVANIVDLSSTCIKSLLDLRANYQITDLNVQVSIAQLSTLKAALMQISACKCESTDFIPSSLEADLSLSLTSCKALIDGLRDRLAPLTLDQTPALSFRKKAQFLLNGKEWSNLQTLLSHQTSAVQLLLTTLQCRTQIEQESLLKRPESRKILSSLRDDSSSLLWLRDDDSSGTRRSIYTETSEFLDSSFTFDAEVLRSKVYLTAMRSNLKQAVRVSAQRIRHGTMSGNAANGRIDEGGKSVIGGEGRRPTKSSGIFHKPQNSISTPSVTEIQESTTDTQSTVSYESVTRPSADWSNGITETPSVAEPDMCTRRAEDEARHGSLQMPSLFKSGKPNLSSSPGSTSVASLHEVKDASAETAILLTGNAKRSALFLQRSMKLAYGRNYTKAIREAFRTSIMRRMIQNMRILLSLIKDLGFSLDPGSEFHAHIIQTVSVADVSESLPTDVCTALAVLWRDPGVLDAYHRGGIQWHWDDPEYFLNSLQRISKDKYKPSLEDISEASCMINNVKDVIVPKKSAGKRHNYRFIDTIGSEAEKSQWIYSSSEVSLVIQVVDAAAYDMPCNGIETTNGFEHDLVFLQQICSSRWLSGTPVLVLLGNTGEMEKKLQGSNIQVYFPNFSGDRTTAGELRFHIRDLFLHVNRKYNNRLRVEFLQSGVTASIGKTAIGIIDKILTEQSILKYGFE